MSTTATLAVILGAVVAPAFTARAWVIGTGPAAALCGLVAALALGLAVLLSLVALKLGAAT